MLLVSVSVKRWLTQLRQTLIYTFILATRATQHTQTLSLSQTQTGTQADRYHGAVHDSCAPRSL